MPGNMKIGDRVTIDSESGKIECDTVESAATGVKVRGGGNVEIQEANRGVILRSRNGHRWRLTVTDTGVGQWLDLDA
jgi:hypothetical protein